MTDKTKAALDALERLLNDALSSRDGYGSSRADAELIRAALQLPEPSVCPYKIPPSGCSMSGGCACSQLKTDADNAYCRYIDQVDKYCRGTDRKLENRSFTREDLSAHTKANELLGFHRGVNHALAALAPRQVDVEAMTFELVKAWGGNGLESRSHTEAYEQGIRDTLAKMHQRNLLTAAQKGEE